MKNPWEKLMKQKHDNFYVLEEDAEIIKNFNEYIKGFKDSENYRIHSEIMPAPFMGDILNSKIVILTLNPGYDVNEEEYNYYKEYKHYWEKQIVHEFPVPDYPLFCFDKKYVEKSDYWKIKLDPLIQESSVEKVAKQISIIQFFPYHSKKYRDITKRISKDYLVSQQYNFELVRKAIARDAIIIIQRSKRLWLEAVPELKKLDNEKKLFNTNSYLNPIMSEKNLPDVYGKLIEVLNS
jgi:hypothetical protein